jgi:divalent metal cation (Fe/Co/Zn/Cd) transporter
MTVTTLADVSTAASAIDPDGHVGQVRLVRRLSWLTVAWLMVDGAIGLAAGLAADSVTLIGWGLDCAIQSGAALVVVWRFSGTRVGSRSAEHRAGRLIAASYLLLVPYIVVTAGHQLLSGDGASGSWIGVALAGTDAVLMPVIGRAKQHAGTKLASPATTSAGRQNILCAYLSLAVLLGLAANTLVGWWWADPLVALAVAVACVQAGVSTWAAARRGLAAAC